MTTGNLILPRSTPEAQGMASSAVLDFVNAVEKAGLELHSLMLLRHGNVVAEGWWSPYAAGRPHMLYSLSKSFTSTAAGLAAAERLLSVDDPVLKFFPEDGPASPGPNLKAMKVRHLLSMSTGHAEDTLGPLMRGENENWAQVFLAQPVEFEPGTHFLYNSGATYIVSAIVQRVTGQRVLEYLTPRLFEPLGVTGATWETCPRGIDTGGWGLSIKTEDIARFGQLYLQKGEWQGRRLISESWVNEATSRQVPNGDNPESDWNQGYGYQFWRSRHGAYRGDGAFGQFCVVLPEQDAVAVTTAGSSDMQGILNRVWDHLLPAMRAGAKAADASATGAAADRLRSRLSGLALPPPQGSTSSAAAAKVSGRTYTFPENEQGLRSMAFEFGDEQDTVRIRDRKGGHRIAIGHGAWIEGATAYDRPQCSPVAAAATWTGRDTYQLKLCFVETPSCPTLTFRFAGSQVSLNYRANVAFGPTERPEVVGTAAG